MRALFNWYDRLPLTGHANLRWFILLTILGGLWVLYQFYGVTGAIAASALAFFLVLLRCIYPKLLEIAEPEDNKGYVCCAPILWTNEHDETYECWFHLYETSKGRKAVYVPAHQQFQRLSGDMQQLGERHIVYNKVILPWINNVYTNEEIADLFNQPAPAPRKPTPRKEETVKAGPKVLQIDEFRKK